MNHTSVTIIEIEHDQADRRIDNFLIYQLKGVPKTRIYRLLRKGEVRVNKKRVKPDYRLCAGDSVRIPPIRTAEQAHKTIAQNRLLPLQDDILYEDSEIIVLNKPSKIPVHGGSGASFGVIETLRQLRPEAPFLELVHRLDKETSGCLLIAKTRRSLKSLHEQLQNNQINKTYHALVKGHWPKRQQRIDLPLKKYTRHSGERIVRVDEEAGKPSLTHVRCLQFFSGATLLEVSPKTGRTHQIRVHTQALNHPILGDSKYTPHEDNLWAKQTLQLDRLFLHAAALCFQHPTQQKKLTIQAPYPPLLTQCLEKLSKIDHTR